MTLRPRRSALFMPGSNARALAKARTLQADVVIMDLEDAVAPESKRRAREQVAAALAAGGYGEREVVVRSNHLRTPWFADDLAAIAPLRPAAVLAPKVEDASEVSAILSALDAAGAAPDLALWVMIETPRGVLRADAICAADPRVACLVVGTSDLAKTLRSPPSQDRAALVPALAACVLAARASGIDVLDGVQLELEDMRRLAAACEHGRALGFDGKTLIHPRQIATANAAFAPSEPELAAARQVVDAFASARARGAGVVVLEGRLVESLHVEEAERTLALADAIARREASRGP